MRERGDVRALAVMLLAVMLLAVLWLAGVQLAAVQLALLRRCSGSRCSRVAARSWVEMRRWAERPTFSSPAMRIAVPG